MVARSEETVKKLTFWQESSRHALDSRTCHQWCTFHLLQFIRCFLITVGSHLQRSCAVFHSYGEPYCSFSEVTAFGMNSRGSVSVWDLTSLIILRAPGNKRPEREGDQSSPTSRPTEFKKTLSFTSIFPYSPILLNVIQRDLGSWGRWKCRCWSFGGLTIRRWRQYVPPIHWYLPTSPHDVTAQRNIDM
jgi:hypothetical protein